MHGDAGRPDRRVDTYKIADNDFMASGGDGYPNFFSRSQYATQDIMDQVLADYVTAKSPLNPIVLGPANGRINCADPNGSCHRLPGRSSTSP